MTDPAYHTDHELLQLIARGDELAFSRLVARYWNTIFSHALAYLKSVERAEEVTQDVFMRLWKARAGLGKVTSPKDYLFVTARNQVFNETRKRIELLYDPRPEAAVSPDSPAEQAEFRETYQLLLKGVALLPEKRQRVFRMSRLEGMSNEQIAAALGMHKDTVYQYLVKALNFLRIYLREHSDDAMILFLILGASG